MPLDFQLPIDGVLKALKDTLHNNARAVLVAPPGAGKTTRVPLALYEEAWLKGQKILMLEPRRLAARAAAERMAQTLGERTGDTVGLRARLASKSGPNTRIEVITEGVFTRMILDDPTLNGIGAVIFDEFHERSLDADFGLALALDCQSSLRDDLRLLVMSATLDGARVADLLGGAPVIESEGRAFPVETRYVRRDTRVRIEDQVVSVIEAALRDEIGSMLVFLPGQKEIRGVERRLNERLSDPNVVIAPLYGAMDMGAQLQAVRPASEGTRKIVLATAIAETSLTIEGVRVVIDSGLARVPRFEPNAGITRLETVRASQAAADQRRGRAGRTEPGVCYRLWDEPQTRSLPAYAEPEILSAGLAGLMLDCAEWGVTDPAALRWLDAPPQAALNAARAELTAIDAIQDDGQITGTGRAIRRLPLPPRLARMVLMAGERGAADDAAAIAAVIVERGLGGNDTDLSRRLTGFRNDRSRRALDMRRAAARWVNAAAGARHASDRAIPSIAEMLAFAFPERIAISRGAPGSYLLASGRGVKLDETDPLAKSKFLVVAELQGAAAATRILLAAALDEDDLGRIAGDRIVEASHVLFDEASASLQGRRQRMLDAIFLSSEPVPVACDDDAAELLVEGIAKRGLQDLPWSKDQLQLLARARFLRQAAPDQWPDLSFNVLANSVRDWLAPFIGGKSKLSQISADDLGAALDALLPWDQKKRLDHDAPKRFMAPSGQSHGIAYDSDDAPALHIRVQELFGLKEHPSIASGRLPLTLHLLSPAHRPIQITRDLPQFWAGSWQAVKAEMKGRYPKHVWPDDPANAEATARAKPRK